MEGDPSGCCREVVRIAWYNDLVHDFLLCAWKQTKALTWFHSLYHRGLLRLILLIFPQS